MTLTPEKQALLEKPFALHEHGTVNNNPYIKKSAIRRRLDAVDPEWSLGEPSVLSADQDLIVLRGSLTICGVTRHGVGTGIIIRTRKDDKTGEIVDLSPYDIARNTAKAYKQAASDILPRAAVQFNCGAYLSEKPKGMKLEDLITRLNKPAIPVGSENAPKSNEKADLSAKAAGDYEPQATTPERAKAALNGHGHKDGQKKGSEWSVLRNDLFAARSQHAPNVSYAEWGNTVNKLHEEGAFEGMTSFEDLITAVMARIESHRKEA